MITKEARALKNILNREIVSVKQDIRQIPISRPPKGHYRVSNLYVDSATGKLVIVYDDTPAT